MASSGPFTSVSTIHDPLSMDLAAATTNFLEFLDTFKEKGKEMASYNNKVMTASQLQLLHALADRSNPFQRSEISQVLNILSNLLKNQHLAIKIVELYRPIVLDLVARWMIPDS
ncbi:hypothetical protein BX616_001604, partial [Lobosporangium transversale]